MKGPLPESLISLAAVREWKVERENVAAQVDRLSSRLSELDTKLAAVQTLLPDLDIDKIAAPELNKSRSLENPKTIPDLLESILLRAEGAHTLKSLWAAAMQTDFAERLSASQNGFYNATSRLTARGTIVREGDMVYARDVYARIKAGEIEDHPHFDADDAPKSAFPDFINSVLAGKGFLKTKELIAQLRKIPNAEARLNQNPQYIYTILGRMTKRGQVIKKDGSYALPSEANEPLNGVTVGGSRASEGHHPSLFVSPPAAARH